MNDITALGNALNVGWILLGAALVFFMQAGFAMVETGFTRAKNAGNIIMKNLMDFSLGTPIFWIFGFGLMFGGTGALIGGIDLFTTGGDGGWATLIFQTVFCATAATIVSGSMAERTKFSAYCIYSMLISAIVYPISGHWIWGGGWHSWASMILPVPVPSTWSAVRQLSSALRFLGLVSASTRGTARRAPFPATR